MDNVGELLERTLQSGQLAVLKAASEASAGLSVSLYLVGGTVRDLLLDRVSMDLDISVENSSSDMPEQLAGLLGGEVVSRSEFGTAKLVVGDVQLDLVAARRETYTSPGALPTVSPGDIADDLARRDFSINAMAVSLHPDEWGRLLDPHEGLADLEVRVLRVLHDASFTEDATRILRAVRYMARLGLGLEPTTAGLLRHNLHHMDGISGDRVRNELVRLLEEKTAPQALDLASDLGVLAALHPALVVGPGVRDRLAVAAETRDIGVLALLAAITYDIEETSVPGLVRRLNMDSEWAQVVQDVASVRSAIGTLASPDTRPSRIHSALRRRHPAAIEGSVIGTDDTRARANMERYLAELRHEAPLLNGGDIMALGLAEGPMVGEALDALLNARLDGEVSTREDEERLVRERLGL
jgi:tRNA nucleotidyltransferase (CCA-adding enzyme)